jgi:hypothetical protein
MTGIAVYPKIETKGSCIACMVPKSRDNAKVAEVVLVKETEEIVVSPAPFNIPLFWNNPWEVVPSKTPYVAFVT